MRRFQHASRLYSTVSRWKHPLELPRLSVKTSKEVFALAKPVLLPRAAFSALPAISKWFQRVGYGEDNEVLGLNVEYLFRHRDTYVPLEFTFSQQPSAKDPNGDVLEASDGFVRKECPLSDFLNYVAAAQNNTDSVAALETSMYLAQCPIASLPSQLQDDLPVPDFVLSAGKGDIYDSSIWIGPAPTYTPLHRDPNPNLFVQMAGSKTVRLFEPALGQEIFRSVQQELRRTGSASIRGEEMMQGEEKRLMQNLVWNEPSARFSDLDGAMEATLGTGDGVFIPKGWWHSVIGTGIGIVGSANWWFR